MPPIAQQCVRLVPYATDVAQTLTQLAGGPQTDLQAYADQLDQSAAARSALVGDYSAALEASTLSCASIPCQQF